MKSSITICVVAASLFSVAAASNELSIATATSQPQATPAPELLGDEDFGRFDLRQATAINNAATQDALQYPAITTQWLETLVNGATTYLPVVYTQTFAAVPDQWPSPVPGQIGLGTLTKEKRDAAPEPTVYLIPLEMVLQTVSVIVPIEQVLPVEVIQPVTLVTYSLLEDSAGSSGIMPSYGTISRQNGSSGIGSSRFFNGSTGASRSLMAGFAAATAWNRTLRKR